LLPYTFVCTAFPDVLELCKLLAKDCKKPVRVALLLVIPSVESKVLKLLCRADKAELELLDAPLLLEPEVVELVVPVAPVPPLLELELLELS